MIAVRRTVGAAAVTALLCTGAVACGNGDAGKGDKASDVPQSHAEVTQALTAAYKKTADAKSAKVEMVMKTPAALGADGGTMKMSGTMGWDPTVMDMTMSGSAFTAADADMPDEIRMIWQNNVMYMDMGAKAAADMDGKRWMKMDLGAAAESAGDEALSRQMTGSLESANQDPAQQIAVLLDSPNLKHLGSAQIDGVQAQHYKGKLGVDEMVAKSDSLKVLDKADRDELLKNIKKAGIKDYDTELWVNEDDLPVRLDVTMNSAQGAVEISEKFSDYGSAVKVQAPPANQTYDLMQMLKELGAAASESADTGV